MEVLELITKGNSEEALEKLIFQAKSNGEKDHLKSLLLLKSNLKKTNREFRLGLITQENYNVVNAKTSQYLIQYIQEDSLAIDPVEIESKYRAIIKLLLSFLSIVIIFYGVTLFFLRRDILGQIFSNGNFDDFFLLILPTLLLFGGFYSFLKIRSHA